MSLFLFFTSANGAGEILSSKDPGYCVTEQVRSRNVKDNGPEKKRRLTDFFGGKVLKAGPP